MRLLWHIVIGGLLGAFVDLWQAKLLMAIIYPLGFILFVHFRPSERYQQMEEDRRENIETIDEPEFRAYMESLYRRNNRLLIVIPFVVALVFFGIGLLIGTGIKVLVG